MSLDSLLAHAARHHGVLRVSDAEAHGVTRKQLDSLTAQGLLELMGHCVFRVRGAPQTWDQRVLVACYQVGPQALACRRTATALRGLRRSRPGKPEVLVPRGHGARPPGVRVYETRTLRGADVSLVGVIPATSVERTIIDMAGMGLPEWVEPLLDDAVHKGLTTSRAVASHLATMSSRGRRGVGFLRKLLAERAIDPTELANAWENLMSRLIRTSDLPTPVRQRKVVCGEHTYYLDFAFEDQLVAIECDSTQEHSTPVQRRYDLDRQHRIEDQGWVFRRFVPEQAKDNPDATVQRIRAVMRDRGWVPPATD